VAAGTDQSRIAMFNRLQLAQLHDELKAVSASRALLDAIVAAPETLLPASDPVRVAALLRISNQAAAARDTAAAATALTATGLSPEQCALVDVRPQPINKTITDKAFPALAIDWRTGGFARIGYDITADGGTTNVRTIAASPPFVFGPGTVKAVSRFRYQPVLRPGNMIGCSGSEHMQYFRVSG
jgi:outer membrane biosynthesis protein TonB